MNKNTVKNLRTSIEAALKQVEAQYGVTVDVGNARFTDRSVKFQFNVIECDVDSTGNVIKVDPAEADFKANHWRWNLKADALGKTFFVNGLRYTLVGSKSRNTKYPIIATAPNGKRYKFTVRSIASLQG
jgi:hypothetical protein